MWKKRSFSLRPVPVRLRYVPRDVGGALSAELAVWIRLIWIAVIDSPCGRISLVVRVLLLSPHARC